MKSMLKDESKIRKYEDRPTAMVAKLPSMNEAEALALRAVAFLAERRTEFLRFADLTGLPVSTIKRRLNDQMLLGAVLDYVLYSDTMVRDFTAALKIDPGLPRLARARLPGAALQDT